MKPDEFRVSEHWIRAVRAALPNVDEITKMALEANRIALPTVQLAKVFTSQHRDFIKRLNLEIPKLTANVQLPRSVLNELPSLKLDYAALFPDLSKVSEAVATNLLPAIKILQEIQRDQFAQIFKQVRTNADANLPPNWRSSGIAILTNLDSLLLDEGLALAWVPESATVAKLFAAGDASERRKVISNRWRGIVRNCEAQLNMVSDERLTEHVAFARQSLDALRDGKSSAAQALSASLLDTVLRASFDSTSRRTITGQKSRLILTTTRCERQSFWVGSGVRTASSGRARAIRFLAPSRAMRAHTEFRGGSTRVSTPCSR